MNTHGTATFGHGVAAVTGHHPDLLDIGVKTTAHWVEVNGEPRRMTQGGIDTYPDREAAVFAAKATANRLDHEAKLSFQRAMNALDPMHDQEPPR